MRILVTGGAGYIGSHAVRLFLARGHDVWVYDNLVDGPSRGRAGRAADRRRPGRDAAARSGAGRTPHRGGGAFRRLRLRRRIGAATRPSITRTTSSTRSTCSTPCAGSASSDSSSPAPAPPTACPRRCRSPRTSRSKPINPYGNTKLAVERALADYAAAYGWGFAALRYFNAAGASAGRRHRRGPRSGNASDPARASGDRWASGRRIEVFGTDYPTPDGTCIRDYIHVDDLAEAHLLALETLTAGQGAALQSRHRPGLQRARGDPHGGGSDRQERCR